MLKSLIGRKMGGEQYESDRNDTLQCEQFINWNIKWPLVDVFSSFLVTFQATFLSFSQSGSHMFCLYITYRHCACCFFLSVCMCDQVLAENTIRFYYLPARFLPLFCPFFLCIFLIAMRLIHLTSFALHAMHVVVYNIKMIHCKYYVH